MEISFNVLIITGSRDFTDRHFVFATLDKEHAARPITLLVHGDARGADTLADHWARAHQIKVDTIPADWGRYGIKAGPIRNIEMLEKYPGAKVIGFSLGKSTGTRHCMREAKKRGHEVVDVSYVA